MDNRPGCLRLVGWIGYLAVAFVTLAFMMFVYLVIKGVAYFSVWFQVNMGLHVVWATMVSLLVWAVLIRQGAMLLELLGRFYLMVEVRIAKVYGWLLDRIR